MKVRHRGLNDNEGMRGLCFLFVCFLFFLIMLKIGLLVCVFGCFGRLVGSWVVRGCGSLFLCFSSSPLRDFWGIFFLWFFRFSSSWFASFSLSVCKHQEALKKICGFFSCFSLFLRSCPKHRIIKLKSVPESFFASVALVFIFSKHLNEIKG
jgi:hypothetical protein